VLFRSDDTMTHLPGASATCTETNDEVCR